MPSHRHSSISSGIRRQKYIVLVLLAGFLILAVVSGCSIIKKEVDRIRDEEIRKETERIVREETERITQSEIERITSERTEEISRSIQAQSESQDLQQDYHCDNSKGTRQFASEPYYIGPLIDTHVHMPVASRMISSIAIQSGFEDMPHVGDIPIDDLICIFDNQGITKTFGFFLMPNAAMQVSIDSAKTAKARHGSKLIVFFMPPPIKSLNPGVSELQRVLRNNKGLFNGYGEVAFYMRSFGGVKPNDPEFVDIYRIAKDQNMIVMIHPGDEHKQIIDEVFKANPDVKFIMHGHHDRDWILGLMVNYTNLYYTVDAELTSIYGTNAEHFVKMQGKNEWLNYHAQNFNASLEEALQYWKPAIEAYPDRFMWGTDRWHSWHFESEVGELIEEISRSFIGRLDPNVQEKFAYRNAEMLLQS